MPFEENYIHGAIIFSLFKNGENKKAYIIKCTYEVGYASKLTKVANLNITTLSFDMMHCARCSIF
jgi:hypothetical protein